MMSTLATIQKELHAIAAPIARKEKEVADVLKPQRELEALQRQQAELLAEHAQIKAKVDQWKAERADHLTWLDAVETVRSPIRAQIESADALTQACAGPLNAIDIGVDASFFGQATIRLHEILAQRERRIAIVANLEKQILALGGEL